MKADRRRFFRKILHGAAGFLVVFPARRMMRTAGKVPNPGGPFPFKRPPDDFLKIEELDSFHPWAG